MPGECGRNGQQIVSYHVISSSVGGSGCFVRCNQGGGSSYQEVNAGQPRAVLLADIGTGRQLSLISAAFLQQVADTMESGRHWRWK
jgi:hypothetical protein